MEYDPLGLQTRGTVWGPERFSWTIAFSRGGLLRPDSTMFPPWNQELMFTIIFFCNTHFTFEVTNCDLGRASSEDRRCARNPSASSVASWNMKFTGNLALFRLTA